MPEPDELARAIEQATRFAEAVLRPGETYDAIRTLIEAASAPSPAPEGEQTRDDALLLLAAHWDWNDRLGLDLTDQVQRGLAQVGPDITGDYTFGITPKGEETIRTAVGDLLETAPPSPAPAKEGEAERGVDPSLFRQCEDSGHPPAGPTCHCGYRAFPIPVDHVEARPDPPPEYGEPPMGAYAEDVEEDDPADAAPLDHAEARVCPTCGRRPDQKYGVAGIGYSTWPCLDPCHQPPLDHVAEEREPAESIEDHTDDPPCRGQWCCGCDEHPIGKPWGWNYRAWERHNAEHHAAQQQGEAREWTRPIEEALHLIETARRIAAAWSDRNEDAHAIDSLLAEAQIELEAAPVREVLPPEEGSNG